MRSVHAQRSSLACGGAIIDTIGWNEVDEENMSSLRDGPTPLYKDVIGQLITLLGVTDVVVCGGADAHLLELISNVNADVVGREAVRLHVVRKVSQCVGTTTNSVKLIDSEEVQQRMDKSWERLLWLAASSPRSVQC